jgi:predicted Zn finger-like uncharacterized protein
MKPHEKICSHCGTVYYVTDEKVMFGDKGTDECGVCGEKFAAGKGSRIISFKRGTRPDDR